MMTSFQQGMTRGRRDADDDLTKYRAMTAEETMTADETMTAEEIMTEEVVTIAPDATIEALAELMVDKRISPILVVEAHRLVGIVSRSDIIRQMAQEFGQEG